MSSTATKLQEVDPSAPGNIIRAALAFESFLTIGSGVYCISFPRRYLLQTMGAAAAQATTTAIQSTQQYGAMSVLIGAGVAFFIPNTKNVIESRQTLYIALLGWEVLFVPLLAWQAFEMEGGMSNSSLLALAGQFVPVILWRAFTLSWKPQWFGRCREERKVK